MTLPPTSTAMSVNNAIERWTLWPYTTPTWINCNNVSQKSLPLWPWVRVGQKRNLREICEPEGKLAAFTHWKSELCLSKLCDWSSGRPHWRQAAAGTSIPLSPAGIFFRYHGHFSMSWSRHMCRPWQRMPASSTSHLHCRRRGGERHTPVPGCLYGTHSAFVGSGLSSQVPVCFCSSCFTSSFSLQLPALLTNHQYAEATAIQCLLPSSTNYIQYNPESKSIIPHHSEWLQFPDQTQIVAQNLPFPSIQFWII